MLGCCSVSVLLVLLAGGVTAGLMPYPWHASCQVDWFINDQKCSAVKEKLVNQINAWQGDSGCGQVSDTCPSMPCGQKCLYELVSQSDQEIVATHKTPVARYIDDVTFTFEQTDSKCKVQGYSTSQLWYAVLDFGTNYCNLRNLLDGAGFTEEQFVEVTEDSKCTQYTSRDCSRY
eukprot:TRINITY_DN20578_c0_g1_i6.p1 TRINITY_DN20578_c0_g1~~TRINITY_DN20578_c0_g1_i6.p1  ORF type:complete len:175 (-),score=31.02 TRINITY_DN20578_c0_g1_i6:489-1013(-)